MILTYADHSINATPVNGGRRNPAYLPTLKTSCFTMVELLVVISVLLVLAALLLPALGRAKNTVIATHCASNMRQLYSGSVIYASDNDGRLPPHHANAASSKGFNELGSPTDLWYLYSWGEPYGYDPDAWNLGYMNLGLLYQAGLVTEPDLFYCPGMDFSPLQRRYYDPWPNPTAAKGRIRGSYYYNPQVTVTGGDGGMGTQKYTSTLKDTPPESVMLMDIIYLDVLNHPTWIPDINSHWSLFSWNITRADGSTQRVSPPDNEMMDLGSTWHTGSDQSWYSFLDAVELLQKP